MVRSMSSAFLVAGLVIGLLLAVGTRSATSDATRFGAPPTVATTSTTTAIAATTTTAAPTTTAPAATTSTTAATTTSLATTTSTTVEPTPTTIITGSHDPPVLPTPPTSVVASNSSVGAGGRIDFTGVCDRDGFGGLFVRIAGTTTVLVDTELTSRDWTYPWTAPTDPRLFSSFTFEFWCGDPTGSGGTYPSALRRRVDMVASQPPSPPSPTGDPTSDPATVTLPDTR